LGNPGRSGHKLSVYSSEKIYDTRAQICGLVGIDEPERIVFTENASYALNLAIKNSVKSGDHILISDIEHNSVLRTVDRLSRECACKYEIFPHDAKVSDIELLINDNTSLVVSNAVSNVNGCENSLKAISKLRQKYNFRYVIDASQMLGHKRFLNTEYKCDILCAPSHKALFGIQGSGFCVFFSDPLSGGFIDGGSGNESRKRSMPDDLPERFEAGTLPTPSIVSLGEGIKYINTISIEAIEEKISVLSSASQDRLLSIPRIEIYGAQNGVVSFNIKDIPSHIVAKLLDENGICVRSGLHCAPLAHERIGTITTGTVRISFSYFNTIKELDKFYKILREIVNTN